MNFPRVISACPPFADNVFGPIFADTCRQGFDFTLLFEHSVLSMAPSAVLILITPLRLYQLYRISVKTKPSSMHGAKAVTAVVYAALQLILLVLWSMNASIQTRASVPSAVLSFIDALAIFQLSYVEHTRSVRPSALLNVYLLLSLIFDIAQARTLYLRRDDSVIAAVFTIGIGIKLALLILEAQGKRPFLKAPYRDYPPEATSGIINQSLLWWLNSLFFGGFQKLLSADDLYMIDNELSSERLRNNIQVVWNERCRLGRPKVRVWKLG